MRIKNISSAKFSRLKKLPVPANVFNTESSIFVFDSKDKWKKDKKVFKRLYITEGEVFSNKLYTINEEIDKKDIIELEELVLPKELISVGGDIVGFSMPYVNGINLRTALSSFEFSTSDKIKFLKEIGYILEKMKYIRKYNKDKGLGNFYINDLHASNFILNLDTKTINVVDMDSAKIGNNLAMPSRYLNNKSNINHVNKYKKCPNNVGGLFEPSYDTELYCYIMVIFEYIFGRGMQNLDMKEFYYYLQYLCDIGVPKELIDKFALIYMEPHNENPCHLLDALEEFYGKTSKQAFYHVRDKKGINF